MAGRTYMAILGCIAILGVVGCGSGSGMTSGSMHAASAKARKAFIAEANEICRKASAERAASVERSLIAMSKEEKNLSPAAEQTRVGLQAVLPREEEMVEELQALQPPTGDEAEIEEMIKLYDKGLEELKAEPQSAFTSASQSGVNEMIKAYGLSEECAI